ncbi:LANO_0F11606g1_1 [Lachancea nothofagi CBS 11611]|uniref:Glutamyl-tRNA(Gln) amidotransferase subunit B, mitochondrial n=1 Tax=Lachancea nothofagi CBS 11611 TaxID=1266666 RepID=A0A1G4KAY7_9SACH|nr:LANO_0F11606g1_1 [Lachancea nothofagi CBS 11611]
MIRLARNYGSKAVKQDFHLLPDFKLKCGLEIHTQLSTQNKLFSHSTNDPFASANVPNFHTSFFDVALPGTQPNLNLEAVLFAVKLAVALKSEVNLSSQFDRKHYFYGDQPLGYQITQHYNPLAKGGSIELTKALDGIDQEHIKIDIMQLQIEQDTGKSIYRESEHVSLIDLNRSNVPLIEMVTLPNFTDLKQIRSFIKKYQNLVRHLGISTGDLETGAMRVDVNMSINDYCRVELKNLPNTSSIMNAVKFEYKRQVDIIRRGDADELLSTPETRGWTGSSTVKLRSKETTIDYRYMPDPEIPLIELSPDVVAGVKTSLPVLPDEILRRLMSKPYFLSLKDAKILTVNGNGRDQQYTQSELLTFYLDTFEEYLAHVKEDINPKLPTNWIIHELLGNLNRLQFPLSKALQTLTPSKFAELLVLIHEGTLSKASGKLLLFHILEGAKGSIDLLPVDLSALIDNFELNAIQDVDPEELKKICSDILSQLNDPKLLEGIITGKKKNSLKFLVGQGMRLSQGRVKPQLFEQTFKKLLKITW